MHSWLHGKEESDRSRRLAEELACSVISLLTTAKLIVKLTVLSLSSGL